MSSVHDIQNDPKAVADIVAATLEMLPPGHSTMMRRMAYRRAALATLGAGTEVSSANAWTSDPAARIGFFNDGTLANWWDGFAGDIVPGGAFEASVTVRNYGFSTPVKPRRPEFVLAAKSGEAVEIKTGFDCRALQPTTEDGAAAEHEISVRATLPSEMPKGPYCLGIWFPDQDPRLRYRPEYAIRLATAMPCAIVGGRLLNVLAGSLQA